VVRELVTDMDNELKKSTYPDACGGPGVASFATVLKNATVSPEPTNAAPGTSSHGIGGAVDFTVWKGSLLVAGTVTSAIKPEWQDTGWDAKLKAAITGTKLKGPLQNPFEPWHWSL
jgi:hypothetical protein